MKFSKYQIATRINDKYILFNTYNSAIIELNKQTYDKYQLAKKTNDCTLFDEQEIEILTNENFIVSEDEEVTREKEIADTYFKSKISNGASVKIDIGITNKCNFHCSYCFENGNRDTYQNTMDEVKFEKLFLQLKEYVNNCLDNEIKNVEIVWYGGEPSLELERIIEINKYFSNYSKTRGFTYSNIIITNGFSISKKFLSQLKEQNIQYIQITLDGLRDYHNARRNIDNKTDSFSIILENIKKLIEFQTEVVIRINIDKNNSSNILKLINFLYKYFNHDYIGKYLFIALGRVFGSISSYTHEEYADIYSNIFKKANKLGFIKEFIDCGVVTAFCTAETDNLNVTIDYDGNIYKCWNDIFNKNNMIGNIYTRDRLESPIKKIYMDDLSLENVNNGNCLKCKMIKFCGGLCPYTRLLIKKGIEDNIYTNNVCEKIARKHLIANLKGYLSR
ncbi:radical SAM/SPASM domain-containing protein [Bulleidia sp. zg-1006]|uniref:radical SAM/SPASM domain-containing protein n=1 Tax=Bulleidia sp. zg-1006 TaxID=2806552 RepID=UPI00193A2041|nr:radical SAM protein [Bulleidia sp. zg-1006]QRG87293.1 SPASM domain-containing protein [Bulleidia sp. zg-1006]